MALTLLVLLACILVIVGAAFRLLYVLIASIEEDWDEDEDDASPTEDDILNAQRSDPRRI